MKKKATALDFTKFMITEEYKKTNTAVFCKMCGMDLRHASMQHEKGNADEIYYQMHYSCYKKNFMR